jgi:Uma2 family endonuclease
MSTSTQPVAPAEVDYPETDGLPMAENTVQARWIVTIHGGLDALFRDNPAVFVAMDLFWYPVRGDNTTVLAPDVMAAFGRPKGDRRSYRQWEEGGVAPQVVFEILSPSNDAREMQAKREFYERHGAEEYYQIDPDTEPVTLRGWRRQGGGPFAEIRPISGWVSPRLGVRFEVGDDLTIIRPDGRPFETYLEVERRAHEERLRADEAERRLDEERLRADEERLRAERLAAKLRAMGLDPDE